MDLMTCSIQQIHQWFTFANNCVMMRFVFYGKARRPPFATRDESQSVFTSLFPKKARSALGIDISSTAVNIIELSGSSLQYSVRQYARLRLPEHAVQAGRICDVNAVISVMRVALELFDPISKSIALAVPNAFIINKTIQLSSALNERDRHAWVCMDVEKHIAAPLQDVYLDFDSIGPCSDDPALLNVQIVASRAEHVDIRVDVLRRVGLVVHIIDVESYVFERAVMTWLAPTNSDTVFVMDIGRDVIRYVGLHHTQCLLSREEALTVLGVEPGVDQWFVSFQSIWAFFLATASAHLQHGSVHIRLTGDVDDPTALVLLAKRVEAYANTACFVAHPFDSTNIAHALDTEHFYHQAPCFMMAFGLALRGILA